MLCWLKGASAGMSYNVGREIHFSYGHRILGHQGKCARLHGHNGRACVEISAEKLDELGMVVDFYKIRETIGKWIDETLDHRMILAENDPLVSVLHKAGESLLVIKGQPTAEALARLIFDEARKKGLPVSRVTLWETENSFASYQA